MYLSSCIHFRSISGYHWFLNLIRELPELMLFWYNTISYSLYHSHIESIQKPGLQYHYQASLFWHYHPGIYLEVQYILIFAQINWQYHSWVYITRSSWLTGYHQCKSGCTCSMGFHNSYCPVFSRRMGHPDTDKAGSWNWVAGLV